MKEKITVRNRWWQSQPVVVTATALCAIVMVISANLVATRRHRFRANVEIADPPVEAASSPSPLPKASSPAVIPDGEVARTATRVREASALVMGLTLLAVNEALARRPISEGQTLLQRFAERGLLPPGIRIPLQPEMMESEWSVIYLRYRLEPLTLEVISTGREPIDGPPVMVRIATGVDENAGVALFIARQLDGVALPAPFTPATQMAALQWSAEPLRERALTAQEMQTVNRWLQSQSGRR